MSPQTRGTVDIEEGVPLARLTTVGVGGPARWLAEPRTVGDLEQAVAWAAERDVPVVPIGLGSNLLAADDGVDALVVRLAGELAAVEIRGELLVAGGGATNAVCLHRVRDAGLGGFEFACAIPGTAGGGVRMNAGAYGSDWSQVLTRALVVDPDGAGWLTLEELDLGYRHSALRQGQVVARVEFRLTPRPAADVKRTVAELNAQRKATQPTNRRTFGSVFKNPAHELGAGKMLESCGLKGHRMAAPRSRPCTRTSSRTPARQPRPTRWHSWPRRAGGRSRVRRRAGARGRAGRRSRASTRRRAPE